MFALALRLKLDFLKLRSLRHLESQNKALDFFSLLPRAFYRGNDGSSCLRGFVLVARIQRIQRQGNAEADVLDIELKEQGPNVLGAEAAGELAEGNLLQDLLRGRQHLLVERQSLLRPVLPGVLVAEPEEDGAIHRDRLDEDQRPVQGDVDQVGVLGGRRGGRALTLTRETTK